MRYSILLIDGADKASLRMSKNENKDKSFYDVKHSYFIINFRFSLETFTNLGSMLPPRRNIPA